MGDVDSRTNARVYTSVVADCLRKTKRILLGFDLEVIKVGYTVCLGPEPHLPWPLRARARITWHFAAGPQARWRDASHELYPRWYVRSEQQSQRACGPQPEKARRRVGICFVAAPRRCTPTSPASRRLASAHPALAPKCQLILARALRGYSLGYRSEKRYRPAAGTYLITFSCAVAQSRRMSNSSKEANRQQQSHLTFWACDVSPAM